MQQWPGLLLHVSPEPLVHDDVVALLGLHDFNSELHQLLLLLHAGPVLHDLQHSEVHEQLFLLHPELLQLLLKLYSEVHEQLFLLHSELLQLLLGLQRLHVLVLQRLHDFVRLQCLHLVQQWLLREHSHLL